MEVDPAAARRRDPLALTPPFGKLTAIWLICAVLLIGATYAARPPREGVAEAYFFWRHDLPVLAFMIVCTAALGWPGLRRLLARPWPKVPARAIVVGLAALCLVAGSIGS